MSGLTSDELSALGLAWLGPGNECDREPIHLTGAIQPYGILLGVDPATLRIEVASANLAEVLGVPPGRALGRPLTDVLGAEAAGVIGGLRAVDRLDDVNPLAVAVPLHSGGTGPEPVDFELTAHHADGLLVLELESADHLGEAELVAFYRSFRLALARLRGVGDVLGLCEVAVRQLRQLTGHDRVMAYRFDPDASGHVVAEASRPGQVPYLGLAFPASDIPRQARALYLRNWFRQIPDVNYRPAALHRRATAAGRAADPLDLGQSGLRSVSPLHLQYLRNMGVRASASISLVVEDQLWGLLAFHHDAPKWIPPYVRAACETVGRLLSLQVAAAQDRSRAGESARLAEHSRQVRQAMSTADVLAEGAAAVPENLLGMVGADGAVLRLEGTIVRVGTTPAPEPLVSLVAALAARAGDGCWHSDRIAEDIPAADHILEAGDVRGASEVTGAGAADTATAAGVLYQPLGHQVDADFVLWLRAARPTTIVWAGRPPDKTGSAGGTSALTPRSSFQAWVETVRDRAIPWSAVELAAAAAFGQAVPELLLRRTQDRLAHMALHDPLTGLPNRTMFLDRLGHALSRSAAPGRTALMFVDIDRFKFVNDSFGHSVGDTLLSSCAERLLANIDVGGVATVARLGGDEFVVLCEDLPQPRDALAVADRVITAFRQPFTLAPTVEQVVTVSVGVALSDRVVDGAELLRQADLALYQAKQSGRDQVVVFDRKLREAVTIAVRTERELMTAVSSGQLVMHYQPIVALQSDPRCGAAPGAGPGPVLHGVEALIRWLHPDRGLLNPADFLHFAEDNTLGDDIGHHVLTAVLTQLASWRDGHPAVAHLLAAVNVTVRQLTRPHFADYVLNQLTAHRIPAAQLCLELTETQLMEQPDTTVGALLLLDAAGVQLAIDDFGTGFSSLAYLRDLPARSLKIDRSFVVGLPADTRDVAVVTAVIRLAHQLGMTTIAEGVETPAQLACLRELGCDYAQGFLLGRPVPAQDFDLDALDATAALRDACTGHGG
jgi:diguanylate cyclase (GGDEF)-like protein